MIRELISPSLRFELREAAAWLGEQLGRACLWRWEIVKLPQRGDRPYDILYIGRKARRDLVCALLGIDGDIATGQAGKHLSNCSVLISEMRVPRALRVPGYLSSIVPLGRTIEVIMAKYQRELKHDQRFRHKSYRTQQVLDDAEIERVDREMLRSYASARHGDAAAQLGLDEVKSMARKFGRLDLLLLEDEEVGCQLGCVYTRAGKRYWSTNRFGYPEAVFSDPKRLSEINSFNAHLALEWAIKNGYDYYDIGISLGRPDGGLLRWKRRRGGELDTMGNYGYFYVRLPSVGTAQFLWDAPLFAVERRKLSLHLGLPHGPNDEEITQRYHDMGFAGLSKVYLHSARQPDESVIASLRSLYEHQKTPPNVEIIPST